MLTTLETRLVGYWLWVATKSAMMPFDLHRSNIQLKVTKSWIKRTGFFIHVATIAVLTIFSNVRFFLSLDEYKTKKLYGMAVIHVIMNLRMFTSFFVHLNTLFFPGEICSLYNQTMYFNINQGEL